MEAGEWEPQRARRRKQERGRMNGEGRDKKRDRETGRQKREGGRGRESALFVIAFSAFFAIVNPLEMEISHINMHCIIPSTETNCFCKLMLSLKRHTEEGYGENVK